ncbi:MULTISPECIES: hypothetical protein [Bacillaceae]|uniref:N-acetyltransferase domain-containing protein n=1 Tax=Evansella alkalicola TaxID=745819 RepID=A0ABS6K2K8_9BACI|nr:MULTISPECIES: hypothetical protein [Bacillaceae]MBU9724362.1 hypothetical protein [Bacillus alkalicola]
MSFIVRKASEEDTLPIQHFIAKTGVGKLPATVEWSSFLIAENEQGDFVSVIRIQKVTDDTGLLRTLIIDSDKVNSLFILEFLEATIHYALEEGLSNIYLLAAGEGTFLQPLGFAKTPADHLPGELTSLEDVQKHLSKGLPVFMKS